MIGLAGDWLDEVAIFNESSPPSQRQPSQPRDWRVPNDVMTFRSISEALAHYDPWWVEDEEGAALTASGRRLLLSVSADGQTIQARQEDFDGGPEIVLAWLRHLAETRLHRRRERASKGQAALALYEVEGHLPGTVEGLLAYVGFDG